MQSTIQILREYASNLRDYVGKCWVRQPDIHGKSFEADLIFLMNGLENLGWQVRMFKKLDDIGVIHPDEPVLGNLIDSGIAIRTLVPDYVPLSTYPDCTIQDSDTIEKYYGRSVWKSSIKDALKLPVPFFIKPVTPKHNGYGGCVIESDTDMQNSGMQHMDTSGTVWCSSCTPFGNEWRVAVIDGQVADMRPYIYESPDWVLNDNFGILLKDTVNLCKRNNLLDFVLDVGYSLEQQRWVIVEFNDGYAFGSYGIDDLVYAKMHLNWWFRNAKAGDT